MQTGDNGGRAIAGSLLTVVGGCLLVGGVLLPWLDVTYALPGGTGTYIQSGWDRPEGKIAFFAGLVMAVAGVAMLCVTAARRIGALSAAVATVVAVAVLGDWWSRLSSSGGGGYGVLVSSAGVLAGLAGVLLSFPGSRTQRLTLLACLFGTCLCGVVLALLVDKGPLFGTF
jgi:hypothetical protein